MVIKIISYYYKIFLNKMKDRQLTKYIIHKYKKTNETDY